MRDCLRSCGKIFKKMGLLGTIVYLLLIICRSLLLSKLDHQPDSVQCDVETISKGISRQVMQTWVLLSLLLL